MHTLDSQNQQRIESDKNDLEDLLGQATRAVQDKRKLTVFIIGAVGFALAALVNYWSLSLAGDIQKVICAIALVAVPGLSTLVTSRLLKKNDERNVNNKFQALLKQRKNLEKASYDFRIDYRHGKAEWAGNEGSDSLKLIE